MYPRGLSIIAVIAALLFPSQQAHGQTTYTWAGSGGGGSGTTWLATADWTGGVASTWPGVGATSNASSGNTGDIALLTLTANVNPLGINMNTAGATFTLGAVSCAGTSFVPTIGNNSTTFFTNTTLQLNNSGATTISGFTNVLIDNSNSTSGTMLFQSFSATNSPRMDIRLLNTTNVINITSAAAGITINSDIYEANPGSGFTLQGAGLLTLVGTGSRYTGPIMVAGEGRINVSNVAGLGTGTVTYNNTTDKSGIGAANFIIGAPGNVTRTFTNSIVLSTVANSGFAIAGNGQIDGLSGLISGGGAGLKLALANNSAAAPNSVFVLANAANSFTATVSVGSGTVAINSDGALGNAANAVSLNVSDSTRGGLRFNANNISTARPIDVLTNSIVDTNGFNATISGLVSNSGGAVGFIKSGAGTLTLSGSANTLNNLTARQGAVVLDYTTNNDNKLDSAASVTLAGATLRMNANTAGSAQTFGGLTINPGGSSALVGTSNGGTGATLNIGNLVRLTVGGTLDFALPTVGSIQTTATNGTAGLLFDGAMTVSQTDWATISSGAVVAFSGYNAKNDASTFSTGDQVTNNAAYTGTLPAGGLTISSLRFNSSATGAITIGAADTLTVASGSFGGILLTPAVTTVQQINGGNLTTTGTEVIVQHYGTGELDISSNITGAIGLTKSGPGRVVLSGANTYNGATVINGGTISVADLTGMTNLGTGTIVLGNGTLEYTSGTSQSLPATRTITLAGAHGPTGATINVTNAATTLTLLGLISGNQVSSLTKTGAGTLAISVSNSAGYFGDTIISNGTLLAGNINALGNTAQTGRVILGDANTGSNNVALLFTLTTGSFPQQVTVSNQGTGTATVGIAAGTAGGMVFNSELMINRSTIIQSPVSGTLQFTNRIGGTGDIIINSQGTGTVNFFRAQGPNVAADWVGNLILNANSTLVLGSTGGAINCDKSVPNTANVIFNTGSTMLLSPGTQLGYETVNALVSNTLPTDGLINQSTGTSPFQLTIGGGGGSGAFGGLISNTVSTLSIVKTGAGVQTLSGANTYSGTTTITGGKLLANNASGSATGSGPVSATGTGTLGSGGTLGGTGTITGTVTVSSTTAATQGGIIYPGPGGTSAGTLNVGSMVWSPLGRYVFVHNPTDTTTGGVINGLVSGTGTLDLSTLTNTSPFDLNLLPSSFAANLTQRTYTIANFVSGITGIGGVPFTNGADVSNLFTISGLYTTAPASFATVIAGTGGASAQAIQLTFTPAAPATWTGNSSGSWNVANDWLPVAVPTSSVNTLLVFGATTHATMTNDIPGTLTVSSLTFNAGAPAYSLSGNGLNFATNIFGGLPQIVSNSSNSVTIGVALTLTNNLTVTGSGNVTLNGAIGGAGSLTVAGTGTLVLGNNPNSYSGGTNVTNGMVQVGADGALGTGGVAVSGLGNLVYIGTTTTSKTFTLSSGGMVSVATGQTVTLSGAKMIGGYLSGPGAFATNATTGAQFANTVTRPSATINSNSSLDQFINVTNGGNLNVAANLTTPLSIVGTTNAGSGTITIGSKSLVNVTDFQSYGLVNISTGASAVSTTLTNVGPTPMYFNGGSRTFVGTIGGNGLADLELNGQNAIVAGGLFVNNGHVSDNSALGISTVIADYGALVKGGGSYDNSPITRNGGRFQSGNSPGVATMGRFVFGPGGVSNYVFAISNATGQAGPTPDANGLVSGWGLVKTAQWQRTAGPTPGDFAWTADSTNKVTVTLDTLVNPTIAGTDVPGLMANFDPTKSYSWPAVEWVGAYNGPTNAAALNADTTFDTSEFANPVAGTFGWNLDPASQTLSLTYTPSAVPEPGTLALVGLAGAGLACWRRLGQPKYLSRSRQA